MTSVTDHRTRRIMTLLGGAFISLGIIAGCSEAAVSVLEVSKDQIAEYERKLAESQARASEDGDL